MVIVQHLFCTYIRCLHLRVKTVPPISIHDISYLSFNLKHASSFKGICTGSRGKDTLAPLVRRCCIPLIQPAKGKQRKIHPNTFNQSDEYNRKVIYTSQRQLDMMAVYTRSPQARPPCCSSMPGCISTLVMSWTKLRTVRVVQSAVNFCDQREPALAHIKQVYCRPNLLLHELNKLVPPYVYVHIYASRSAVRSSLLVQPVPSTPCISHNE